MKGVCGVGQIVYADLLFLVNFSMDFLCFFVTARLLHRPFKIWRGMAAATMGGVYSVAVLFIEMNAVTGLLSDLGFCLLMCLCAYGIKNKKTGEFFLHYTVYFGVSAGTGGCMTAMYSLLNRMELPLDEVEKNPDSISVWIFGILAILSGIIALYGGRLFKSSSDRMLIVDIVYRGERLTVRGMTDTGNMLCDPISGRPVIIIDSEAMSRFIGADAVEAAMRGDISSIMTLDPAHRARLIPMSTANGRSLICAFIPDKIRVESETVKRGLFDNGRIAYESDSLFAPAKLRFAIGRTAMGYAALLPKEN